MPIPPLVCSTPPPPEQVDCDDVCHDEFAISYDLSQEDEDSCTYDDFQSAVPSSPYHVTQKIDNPKVVNECHSVTPCDVDKHEGNSECDNKCGKTVPQDRKVIDEDNNIEDLDLKCEPMIVKPDEDMQANVKPRTEYINTNCVVSADNQSTSLTIDDSNLNNHSNVDSNASTSKQLPEVDKNLQVSDILYEKTEIENANMDISVSSHKEEFQSSEFNDENILQTDCFGKTSSRDLSIEREEDFSDFQFVPTEINLEKEVLGDFAFRQDSEVLVDNVMEHEGTEKTSETDNDFDDFDTLQFSNSKCEIVQNVLGSVGSNPWQSSDTADNGFGDFQATFDNVSSDVAHEIVEGPQSSNENLNDDDFGDFNDFQTSKNSPPCSFEMEASSSGGPEPIIKSFDFKITDNESQLYESIEKSIQSLFDEEEICEKQSVLEGSLESSLCVTWGHLTETEIRQPYMLNWNNSISQKALLKSLCIDSRNILFGPKWSSMPRYAANLGATPLKPMKQTQTSSVAPELQGTEPLDSDKPKPIDAWTDTLSGDGQESCNDTNNQSKANVCTELPQRVYQDDMLKPTKVFPTTLPLQPIRQINLPDTHIFTPTDSEIPRSKTIHYDDSSPMQLPNKLLHTQPVSIHPITSSEMDDFDDYQDFQDTVSKKLPELNQCPIISNCSQSSDVDSLRTKVNKEMLPAMGNITYQSQTILEPIKLEVTVPKLNWPEPGEVKETFDDFSDFVSNSSWSNLNLSSSNTLQNNEKSIKEKAEITSDDESKLSNENMITASTSNSINQVEDEFDNFQFASVLPVHPPANKLESVSNSNPVVATKSAPFLNSLSGNGLLHPVQMQSTAVLTNHAHSALTTSQSQIVQPVSKRFSNNSPEKSSSQQILQPLSLESISQINWPNPGIDIQDLSRFNPINAVHSLHNSPSKQSPTYNVKGQQQEDDGWGEFVSIKPSTSAQFAPKPAQPTPKPAEDDDWSDFISSATPNPLNGLNTISFNVHSSLSHMRAQQEDPRVAIPTLNYITPKTYHKVSKDSQFQNL